MTPRLSLSSLKSGRWYEHLVRFALGGFATVLTGLIGESFGPTIGGVFLALPAIFCASATLIEKHEIRKKTDAGIEGSRRGQQAAAVDAIGTALGSFGLIAFAITFALVVRAYPVPAFAMALLAWTAFALTAWWLWLQMRNCLRARRFKRFRARTREPRRA